MSKKIIGTIGIATIIIIVLGYILYFRPNYYLFNGGKIEFTPEIRKELNYNRYVDFLVHEDAIYFCSREGIEKKNIDGIGEWTKPYQMLSPSIKNTGDYFLVADILGHDAYLFDKKGFITGIRESLPIISAWVNESGQIVLVLEADLENRIRIYNSEGKLLIERGTVLNQDGYPIGMALSNDGIHLATGYSDVFSGKIESKITMFSFDDYHGNLDEFIVRADVYENELVPELHYFDHKNLWAIGSRKAYVYPMNNSKEIYKKAKEIELVGDIKQVYYTNDQVLIYSDVRDNAEQRYHLQVYQMNGELVGEDMFTSEIQFISTHQDYYYVVTQEKISKYRNAKMVWEYPFYEKVEGFYELDESRYLLIQPTGYTVWQKKLIY